MSYNCPCAWKTIRSLLIEPSWTEKWKTPPKVRYLSRNWALSFQKKSRPVACATLLLPSYVGYSKLIVEFENSASLNGRHSVCSGNILVYELQDITSRFKIQWNEICPGHASMARERKWVFYGERKISRPCFFNYCPQLVNPGIWNANKSLSLSDV